MGMTPSNTPPPRGWHIALPRVALTAFAAFAALASTASAHDTWFHPLPAAAGQVQLALGTGNRFPQQEFAVGAEHLARQGCAAASGPARPMTPQGGTPTALLLQIKAGRGALSCWAQLLPSETELSPEKVRIYLDEVNAPAPVRAAWSGLQARGLPWRERYTKHARIELPGTAQSAARASGMGMDMLMLRAPAALKVGDEVVVQVLRDGRPLPGFAVQLRSELSPVGLWQQTDAAGRVRLRPPLAGRWLLRGTELTPPLTDAGHWEGRFVTLAFEVAPAAVPLQAGSGR